jgi:hypothetical protein
VSERVVVVPVGVLDRRTTAALEVARRTRAAHHLAVHVATDAQRAHALGLGWMAAGHPEPLVIVDGSDIAGGVAAHVRIQLLRGADHVVVVAGHLLPSTSWHRLLHDGTAERIAARVDGDPRVISILVPVPTPAGSST